MYIKKSLLLYGCLLFPISLLSQNPAPIRFVNTGKMSVGPNSSGQIKHINNENENFAGYITCWFWMGE